MKIYPCKHDPLTITKPAGIWNEFSIKTELIPINTINKDYIILGVVFTDINREGNYQFKIYKGAIGSEIEIMTDVIVCTDKKEGHVKSDGFITLPKNERVSISIIGDMTEESILKLYLQFEYAKDI